MQTIDQALRLLNFFSERDPEFALGVLAQRAGHDKPKVRRYMLAMMKHGLIEQDGATRRYRLGAGLLRLARVREATHPVVKFLPSILQQLVDQTGETAHFSLAAGHALATVSLMDSPRSHRVTMEKGERLPLHATASGLAYLAFAAPELVDVVLAQPLPRFTPSTLVEPDAIRKALAAVADAGYATALDSYEMGVRSVAVPVFSLGERLYGTLAIASPASRMSQRAAACTALSLRDAANVLSNLLGAEAGDAGALPAPALDSQALFA